MSLAALPNIPSLRDSVTDAEWRARVDLAACYRLLDHYDMTDLTTTHISARVPGQADAILLNPYGLFFEEINASSLIKVDLDGTVLSESPYEINRAAYTIHSAVQAARDDVACVVHTHTRAGMAVSAMECGLLPLTQHSLAFYERMAYHDYEGVALDLAERERLVADLGAHRAMILRNHGLLTAGRTIPEAFLLIYYLEKCCQSQVDAMSSGAELRLISREAAMPTATMFNDGGTSFSDDDWPGHLRRLDRLDPSFRD